MSTIADMTMLVADGQGQIDDLQTKIADLDKQIIEAQSQIDHLAASRSSQVEQIEAARIAVKEASKDRQSEIGAAKIAGGKPRRGQVKDATQSDKALMDAKTTLAELEREASKVEQSTRALYDQVAQLSLKKQDCEAELHLLIRGRDKLREELGQEKLSVFQQVYQEKRQEYNGLREQVAQAERELDALYANSLLDLANWPCLQEDATQFVRPQENATLRAIEASIAYASSMLKEAPHVTNERLQLEVFYRPYVSGTGHAMDIIPVDAQEVLDARVNAKNLLVRLDWLRRFHEQYREHLADSGKS